MTTRERARQILRDGQFDSALNELGPESQGLAQLLEELHIYHAELESQQLALQESERASALALARFRRLHEELPLPALLLTPQGVLKESNRAARALLALDRQLFAQLASPRHQGMLLQLLRQARQSGQAQCREVALRGLDGELIEAELFLLSLPAHDGSTSEIICTVIDQRERIAQHNALLAANERLRAAVEVVDASSTIALRWRCEAGWPITYVSENIRRWGYKPEQLMAQEQLYSDLVHPADLAALAQDFERYLNSDADTFTSRYRIRWADGSVRWVEEQTSRVLDALGKTRHLQGLVTDVTEREEARHALLASEARYRRLTGVITDVAFSCLRLPGEDYRIDWMMESIATLSGYTLDEILARGTWRFLILDEDQALFTERILALAPGDRTRCELRLRRKDGEQRWVRVTAQCSVEAGLDGTRRLDGGLVDISDEKQLAERLAYLVHHDPLTGLPNRAHLRADIEQAMTAAIRSAKVLALLAIDLGNLKRINDSFGHAMGDAVLRETACRLQRVLGPHDRLARFGGDNFIWLAPGLKQPQDSVRIVERIQAALSAPLSLESRTLLLSASIGIALYPEDARDSDSLIGHADAALHLAKAEGAGHYRFYTPALDSRLKEQFQLEQALRQALEHHQEQILLYYQPRVDLETGRILSLEALVRWQHPQWGLIPPARFIPVAESSGLILALGPLVLRLACRQIQRWREAGIPLVPVAVNLSANELYQDALDARLLGIAEEHAIESRWLEFEITESTAMRSIERAVDILERLGELGFMTAIDDFGTGYASLSYLNRLPIKALKIDRSFLVGIGDQSDEPRQGSAIVKAIIGLAETLGLECIAEGVEHLAQRDFLLAHGCHVAQGYLYSRPLPPEALEAQLRAGAILAPGP